MDPWYHFLYVVCIFNVLPQFSHRDLIVVYSDNRYLSTAFLMESIVFPMPFSSFNVGMNMLIFRIKFHSERRDITKRVKRF